jgi:hypothetical protein
MSTEPTSDRGGIFSVGGRAPTEIRVAAALLFGGGLLFQLVGLLRLLLEGGTAESFLLVPTLQLVVALGVAGGLLRGLRSARLFGVVFVLLFALLHTFIALQPFALWVRIAGGVLAIAHVYVAVLLNTRPALLYTGVRR